MKRIPTSSGDLERELTSLVGANIDTLRQRWRQSIRGEPPPCQSGRVLRLLLAWRLQARFGGLSVSARRHLRQLTSGADPGKKIGAPPLALKRGMALAREWKGVVYRVHILEKGFAHEGKVYASLSEVARAITGTRWSGPRFFGVGGGGVRQATVR